jgi:hypothetical protein
MGTATVEHGAPGQSFKNPVVPNRSALIASGHWPLSARALGQRLDEAGWSAHVGARVLSRLPGRALQEVPVDTSAMPPPVVRRVIGSFMVGSPSLCKSMTLSVAGRLLREPRVDGLAAYRVCH